MKNNIAVDERAALSLFNTGLHVAAKLVASLQKLNGRIDRVGSVLINAFGDNLLEVLLVSAERSLLIGSYPQLQHSPDSKVVNEPRLTSHRAYVHSKSF